MIFEDRAQAGRLLAEHLSAYRHRNPLVLAIPRGGVPVGREIVDRLGGELDVVLVHKIGFPRNPEIAVGSVSEEGELTLDPESRRWVGDDRWLREQAALEVEHLRLRRRMYTPVRTPVDPAGRIVIVTDDGLATGYTMIAALRALRARKPLRLIVAVPVAAPDGFEAAAVLADEAVSLVLPADFEAVSRYYRDFRPVEDEEAVRLLRPPAGSPIEASKN